MSLCLLSGWYKRRFPSANPGEEPVSGIFGQASHVHASLYVSEFARDLLSCVMLLGRGRREFFSGLLARDTQLLGRSWTFVTKIRI